MIERLLGELKVANKNNSETILKDIFIVISNQLDLVDNESESTLMLKEVKDLIDQYWHDEANLSTTKKRILKITIGDDQNE